MSDFSIEKTQFDVIGLFFCPFSYWFTSGFLSKKNTQSLKPSGFIIFEAFHKNQLNYSSGWPKDLTMLFSVEEVQKEFECLKILTLEDKIIDLDEGIYHQGKGHVIRMIATKRAK